MADFDQITSITRLANSRLQDNNRLRDEAIKQDKLIEAERRANLALFGQVVQLRGLLMSAYRRMSVVKEPSFLLHPFVAARRFRALRAMIDEAMRDG